ncbi:MAG TPA: hypothetical protein VML50_13275 [Anaeromyxobacter sp.]|nr:hypothetical protein [Anaeromyxobacter sp.]
MRIDRLSVPGALALLGVLAAACGGGGKSGGDGLPPPPADLQWPFYEGGEAVRAIAVADDGTVYVGGTFTRMGPMTGGGAPVDAVTGELAATFPRVDGSVLAAVADGVGGWFIGGDFVQVSGLPRVHLAHVLADGSLDPSWTPSAQLGPDPSAGSVAALALQDGVLYVAGDFDTLGGAPRSGLGAVDGSGVVTSWALAVEGTTVYVAGDFRTVGGVARDRLAAIDGSGKATAFEVANLDASILALAIADGAVLAGGTIGAWVDGSQPTYTMAMLDPGSTASSSRHVLALPSAWASVFDHAPVVNAIASRNGVTYVGGRFRGWGADRRWGLAGVDASGATTTWDPNPHP